MVEQPNNKVPGITFAAGIISVLQGILLFIGLVFDITFFKSVFPGFIEMNSVSAICFIFLGIAFLALSIYPESKKSGIIADVFFLLAAFSGFISISAVALDLQYSADSFLPGYLISNSKMAPNTALLFLIIGMCGFSIKRISGKLIFALQSLLVVSGFIALLALLGYIYEVASFYSVKQNMPMALNTSAVFVLLSLGLLFVEKNRGFPAFISGNSSGAIVAKRLLPISFVVPIVFGWLRLYGENSGLYSSKTGVAVFVVAVIASFFLLVIYTAAKLNREEFRLRKAERIVAESGKKLRDIIDNSPAAIYVKDLNRKFVMVNKTTEKNHGMSEKEIVGKSLSDLFPGNPEAVEVYESNDRKVIESGRFMEFEEQAMLADGLHTYLSLKFPLKDLEGKVYAMCGISTDITYRKNDADKFIAILESAPDAIVIVNRDGNIELINRQTEKMFGYSRDELIGKKVEVLVPDELMHRHPSHRKEFFENHSVRPMGTGLDLQAKRKDGSLFAVEISLSPMDTYDGMLVSASIRDITERKKSERELRKLNLQLSESNNELEAFSYSVSHDLRSPLRHIIGFGEKFNRISAGKLSEEENRLLGKITSSAAKMGALIDDLLMFSRVGRTSLSLTQVDVNKVFEEIVNEYSEPEGCSNIKWILNDMPAGFADPFQLRIVVSNLISNAVKYTGKKPERIIEAGGYTVNGYNEYFVKDNGNGFDMKYSDKLFGVFQRLHSDTDYEGTGIGLATVKRIITRHYGSVRAEGEQDVGAVFYFTLPVK
jgi:PAS domain S-box-containing protein